ncbi:MAG: hypothetical protein J6336_07780 [Kiritimatiellae bacterium]|nr:hypothetical protein [Kiritimatiellia bacterium]
MTDPDESRETGDTLLRNRNRAVGQLLLADCAAEYLAILLALRRFRDNHELEPLQEDLFETVGGDADRFNKNIRQLLDWELITQRIERERLRGYKDTRRRKFRYRISEDALAFVLWLESRRQADECPADDDTRDLLADFSVCLKETVRLLNKTGADDVDEESARTLIHRVNRLVSITDEVAHSLGDFNIRLLAFATGAYQVPLARRLIAELDHFLKRFLKRIHLLRQEISPDLDKLRATRLAARWAACRTVMEREHDAAHLLMRSRLADPQKSLAALADFYRPDGTLEKLSARVNASALMVWQKLHAHLRELERRSHRLEDLDARIKELAALPAETVPSRWLRQLAQPAQMFGDSNHWNETEKATPPLPVWVRNRVRSEPIVWLNPRRAGTDKPVQSLDEYRLERLGHWMETLGLTPTPESRQTRLSQGRFANYDDFVRVFELARSGLLGNGARLAKLGLRAEVREERVSLSNDVYTLELNDLTLEGTHPHGDA